MTLVRLKDGRYEAVFRARWLGAPLHLSLRTRKKTEARERHDAVHLLVRAQRDEMIAQLRAGALTVEAVAAMVANQEPLAARVGSGTSPWGTVAEEVERYLAWLEHHPNRARRTWLCARTELRRFLRYDAVAALPFERVTSATVEAYQRALIAEGTPANTLVNVMARVGTLYRWAATQEERQARDERRAPRVLFSPVDPAALVRTRHPRERYLSESEAERLVAATPEPMLSMVMLGLFAGLRLGEAQHVSPRDVDLELGIVSVREKRLPDDSMWTPKTKRARRSVPLAAPLVPVLGWQLSARGNEAWLHPRRIDGAWPIAEGAFSADFKKVVERAGLVSGRKDPNGVTFHSLRHTFASWLLSRGVDLYTVAQLIGDTLAVSEATYGHLSKDHKVAAVARLSGAVRVPLPEVEL